MQLTLDHGVLTPLVLAGLSREVSIVPLLVNCVQPPLPTMQRCLQWGRMLGNAIRVIPAVGACRGTRQPAASATTSRRRAWAWSTKRSIASSCASSARTTTSGSPRYATEHVNEAGNGAEEIRNWLIAHGAAAGARFEVQYYKPLPNWYAGIGLARWHVAAS